MLNPRVRLEWLASFLAVVDAGGFGSAAEATHRSQPRVSSHVASLERAVGVMLFDRSKRPVELTRAGHAMVRHARAVLRSVEVAEQDMARWRGGTRGIVNLGTFPSASSALVAPLLVRVSRETPDIGVSLVERSTLELDTAVINGEVDLYLRPMSPPPASPIRSHVLWKEDLVVVVPDDHRFAEGDAPLEIVDVVGHPLISIGRIEDTQNSFETYEAFRAAGHELNPVQATNQPQTLVSMVRAGLGIGVTNRLGAMMTDLTGLQLRTIRARRGRSVAVCWLDENLLSPAAGTLLRMICEAPIPEGTSAPSPQHSNP